MNKGKGYLNIKLDAQNEVVGEVYLKASKVNIRIRSFGI
jgi:hypothetical protein|tara:strand:- start:444 stop:560 length:117 start_codon:yes stop_codon:yes gene_type:complete